jgi:deoxycytidylate deaminase
MPTLHRVPEDDPWMREARRVAETTSLDARQPVGSVVVRDGRIVGRGANGSLYHELHGCERARRGSRSGEDYHLCEGCSPANHSEATALDDAGASAAGADLYMWGHTWCCDACTEAMEAAAIDRVWLVQGCEEMFGPPRNTPLFS